MSASIQQNPTAVELPAWVSPSWVSVRNKARSGAAQYGGAHHDEAEGELDRVLRKVANVCKQRLGASGGEEHTGQHTPAIGPIAEAELEPVVWRDRLQDRRQDGKYGDWSSGCNKTSSNAVSLSVQG